METNLKQIKQMAQKKENENWKFRSFIKSYENSEKLDSIVHRLNKEISSKIDCTTCANCCKAIQPTFTQKDITNIAKQFKITPSQFVDQYLVPDDFGNDFFPKTT
ncbi:Fe-S-cluster oxidoreductase, partial [Candidatus Magnetomorum sp. HK-1]